MKRYTIMEWKQYTVLANSKKEAMYKIAIDPQNPINPLTDEEQKEHRKEVKATKTSYLVVDVEVVKESPFEGFKKAFKGISKDTWNSLPQDSSENVDKYINKGD